jgi:hypothetical protein
MAITFSLPPIPIMKLLPQLPRVDASDDRHPMKQTFLILLFTTFNVFAQPLLAPNAPKDNPGLISEGETSVFDRAIAPYVAKARSTYPDVKKRYLAGLPPQHTFFITTRLHDKANHWEQVFIAVESIKDGQVTGRISNQLTRVTGFQQGEPYTFPETDMLDWIVSNPDGSEEGNVVGKFLDTYHPGAEPTVRELLKSAEFKFYSVIFGITIDADSKLQAFKVSKVIDPKSGTTDAVDVQVPAAFIAAAKKKVSAKHYKPKLENNKPVEFFTYFHYSPNYPTTVITDLDQPLSQQP